MNSVVIMNQHDSQGNQICDYRGGVYPTLRGCGGAGYQQGYLFAPEEVWCMNMGGWAGYGEEIAETLRARDYKDPSVVFIPTAIGIDLYNQTTTGEVSKTLNAIRPDSDHVPCVTYAMTTEMTPKIGCEVAPSLRARDYKDPQVVFFQSAMWWNGDEVAGTLTANNANGAQRMPDKENFGCVLVSV